MLGVWVLGLECFVWFGGCVVLGWVGVCGGIWDRVGVLFWWVEVVC